MSPFVPSGGGGGGQGTLLFSQTLGSPGQFTFSNIPQSFTDLLAIFYVQSSGAGTTDTLDVEFNGDSGTNYNVTHTVTTSTATGPVVKNTWDALIAAPTIPCVTLGANFYSWCWMYIPEYAGASLKTAKFLETEAFGVGSGQVNDAQGTGFWNSTAAITSIFALAGTTPFTFNAPSSMRVYGIV